MRMSFLVRVAPVTAAILLLARPDAAGSLAQSPAGPDSCRGFGCYAQFVVSPSPGWTITPDLVHGRGLGPIYPNECVPCRACFAEILWAYAGEAEYLVRWPGGYARGDGPGHGDFRVRTECEATPEPCSFENPGAGAFPGHLTCICHG